jgi:hypothetical protein
VAFRATATATTVIFCNRDWLLLVLSRLSLCDDYSGGCIGGGSGGGCIGSGGGSLHGA